MNDAHDPSVRTTLAVATSTDEHKRRYLAYSRVAVAARHLADLERDAASSGRASAEIPEAEAALADALLRLATVTALGGVR